VVQGKARWVSDFKFAAWDSAGNSLVMDAGKAGGGEGAGLRPIELPLIALCGCSGMDVIEILRKMRQDVRGFEVTVSADREEEDPQVYKGIRVEYSIEGKGIEREKVERAVKLTAEKYCSVGVMLAKTTDITHTITIVEV
jgi:putative redox protein